MCARQLRTGQHERHLESLLDGLLCMKSDDVVFNVGVVGDFWQA
jgi:hypothetical protein